MTENGLVRQFSKQSTCKHLPYQRFRVDSLFRRHSSQLCSDVCSNQSEFVFLGIVVDPVQIVVHLNIPLHPCSPVCRTELQSSRQETLQSLVRSRGRRVVARTRWHVVVRARPRPRSGSQGSSWGRRVAGWGEAA
uniref:Uncharacterized protein n=1 Tax=Cacopsylla melanoneura TaxID=428564 RepID=A0A8D8YJK0_9HEMI